MINYASTYLKKKNSVLNMNTVKHSRCSVLEKPRNWGPSIKGLHNQGLSLQNQDTFMDFQREQGGLPFPP